MTHPPAAAPAGQPPQPGDPGQPGRPADRAVRIQVTPGGYLLGVLAAGFGALTLPAVAPGQPPLAYLAATAALVAALLGSLIAHELGHALVARRYGGSGAVTVGFLGGRRHGRDELPTPRAQWRVAAAGPAGGLDGGRIVRALAWARSGDPARAGLIAARIGQVTGAVLTAAGATVVLTGHLPGLWIAVLGLLMIGASRSEASQALTAAALDGLTIRDLLPPPGTAVPAVRGWQTVQAFLDEAGVQAGRPLPGRPATTAYPAALHTAGHAVVLGPGGALAGVITPADFARAAQFGPHRSPAAGRPAGRPGAGGGTASAGPQPG